MLIISFGKEKNAWTFVIPWYAVSSKLILIFSFQRDIVLSSITEHEKGGMTKACLLGVSVLELKYFLTFGMFLRREQYP